MSFGNQNMAARKQADAPSRRLRADEIDSPHGVTAQQWAKLPCHRRAVKQRQRQHLAEVLAAAFFKEVAGTLRKVEATIAAANRVCVLPEGAAPDFTVVSGDQEPCG